MADQAIELYNEVSSDAFQRKNRVELDFVVHLLAISALSQIGIDLICYPIIERIPANMRRHEKVERSLISMWVSNKPN